MKILMKVKLKNFFPPKEGQYGMSQGAYIVTDKGEFKAYNNGPVWFAPSSKGTDIEVMGEWKQNKTTNDWYLNCSYGAAAEPDVPQGPSASPQSPAADNVGGYTKMPVPATGDEQGPNWDAIARQKIRCALLCAFISSGEKFSYEAVLEGQEFILTGVDLGATSTEETKEQVPF